MMAAAVPIESGGKSGSGSLGEPPLERIYIGGLDPPRLTVEMVARRLTSLGQINVLKVDSVAGNQCGTDSRKFFFLTARLLSDSSPDGTSKTGPNSALDVVSKQYNNVQWRGCTLRVERAKLHFLDRLRAEREEREKAKSEVFRTKGRSCIELPVADKKEVVGARAIPRNLRIRRRFGEEAFSVDTKPVKISAGEGWSGFHRALRTMQRKREKHRQTYLRQQQLLKRMKKRGGLVEAKAEDDVGSLNKKAFLNKAVHLSFRETRCLNSGDDGPSSIRERAADKASDTESTQESTDSKVEPRRKQLVNSEPSSHMWSDEEGEVSGTEKEPVPFSTETTSEPENEARYSPSGVLRVPASASNDEHSSKNMSETSSEEESMINDGEERNLAKSTDSYSENVYRPERKQVHQSSYAWSDDEGSSSDVANTRTPAHDREVARHICTGKVKEYDEFSNAIDFNKDKDREGVTEERPNELAESTSDVGDLSNDVKSNLEVLAQLFPDMAGTEPCHLPQDNDGGGNRDKQIDNENQNPGWGANGLMQRFDPTQASSVEKYEMSKNSSGPSNEQAGARKLEADEENSSDDTSEGRPKLSDSESVDLNDIVDNAPMDKEEGDADETRGDSADENLTKREERQEEQIYEQKKLESIFQQARSEDEGGAFKLSGLFKESLPGTEAGHPHDATSGVSTASDGLGGSNFRFSFGLGQGNQRKAQGDDKLGSTEAPFSFSFDVSGKESTMVEQNEVSAETPFNGAARETECGATSEHSEKGESNECGTLLKKRPGIRFPQSVLRDLEFSFFNLNEGAKMAKNWEAMANDEDSQKAWMEERRSLTLDWKRKQKYAASKKQKKMKVNV